MHLQSLGLVLARSLGEPASETLLSFQTSQPLLRPPQPMPPLTSTVDPSPFLFSLGNVFLLWVLLGQGPAEPSWVLIPAVLVCLAASGYVIHQLGSLSRLGRVLGLPGGPSPEEGGQEEEDTVRMVGDGLLVATTVGLAGGLLQ